MKKQRQELSIHDFIGIFLPKLWIIVSVALIFGIATMIYSVVVKPETYTSSTEMYVYKATQSVTSADIDVAQKVLPNYKRTLFSDDFLKKVSMNLLVGADPYNISVSALKGMISFSVPTDTKFFTISVTSDSPKLSHKVAEVIQAMFPDYIGDKQRDSLYMTLANEAALPTEPNSKGTVKNSIIAALVGFLATLFLVWLAWLFDFVVHDKKKLESRFDIPVLGVIPRQMLQTNKSTVGGTGRDG